ncbi:MAG TPA: OB-fold domain-containing protein [Candidatus Saccharimonadales bacterium]|nr:OB-fold domain-containing protein [Candidatus Saccharimonadales bacterium]
MGPVVNQANCAAKCRKCGQLSYPTHFYCPKCGGTQFDPVPLAGEGKLLTWTRVYTLPLDYDDLYIALGIVELDMGVRALGRLNIAAPRIGARVRAGLGKVRDVGGRDVIGLVFTEA